MSSPGNSTPQYSAPPRRIAAAHKPKSTKLPSRPPPMSPALLNEISSAPNRIPPKVPDRPRAGTRGTTTMPKEALSLNSTRDQIRNTSPSDATITTSNTKLSSHTRSPSPELKNQDTELKRDKKQPRTKKGILRRRTKSKGFHSLRRNPSPLTSTPNINTSTTKATEDIIKPSAPTSPDTTTKKKIILFRVRLQDDNYKTLTIEQTTTASDLCAKLSNKLRKERPEQVWDGCELFETVDNEEITVPGSTILSDHLHVNYLFKRQGEKVANPEEELKEIIKQRKQLHAQRNDSLCHKWFGHGPDGFSIEDQDYLNTMLDILALLSEKQENQSEDSLTVLPNNLQQQIEALEEIVNQARKKYQNAKKVRKKPARLFIDSSRVHVLHKIADAGGSYASIYCVSVNGMECALKELVLDGVADESAFLTEIAVLEALPPHSNLVNYLFHERTEKHIRLFMSLYDGSLQDYIKKRRLSGRGPFPLAQLKKFLQWIIAGVDYLHSFYIVHRDLKSGNIFVQLDTSGDVQNLVVADFDTAIQVENENFVLHQTMGTPGFMAPEVLQAKEKGYTISGDIFSFGMIIFELLFLDSPYTEIENSYEITENIIAGIPPAQPFVLAPEYQPYLFLFRACIGRPAARPTTQEIIENIKQLPDSKEQAQALQGKPPVAPARDRSTTFIPKEKKEEETFINPLYRSESMLM